MAAEEESFALEEFYTDIVAGDSRPMERNLRKSYSATPDIDIHRIRSQYEARERSLADRHRPLMAFNAGRMRRSIDFHCKLQEKAIAFASTMQAALRKILIGLGDSG